VKAPAPASPQAPDEHHGPSAAVRAFLGRPRSVPVIIAGSTALLLFFGLVMVWSASAISSLRADGNSFALVSRQALFAGAGVVGLVVLARRSPARLRQGSFAFLVLVVVLLILVLIPGIGHEVGGQRNWLGYGALRIQPSEFAKLALVLWGADQLARQRSRRSDWREFLVPVMPVGLALVVLVLLEGDFGNAMILTVILAGMLFVAGAPLRLFAALGAVSLVGVAALAAVAPYRVQRFTSFLNADADRLHGAWQVTQGSYAFGNGGIFGVGLGASREKWGTLPAAHTDFIFPVIGEELGLLGTLFILGLFGLLVFAILRLVHLTEDRFVQLFATGVAGWIIIQVVTNIGATLGLLPITGVTLPFLSYGGSSLVLMLCAVGMVLSMAKATVRPYGPEEIVLPEGAVLRTSAPRQDQPAGSGAGPVRRERRASPWA
jgi:cell division protein FtsW